MYTQEDIRHIREARKEKEYLEMLKAARDKIKKGIEQNDSRSGERAIWELIQNARDLDDHAFIQIRLKADSLEFSHRGEAFNLDTLSNLIKQQSTKHEGEDTVGQYGTGFMTTHSFSRKVFVSGDCRIDDENGGGTYIPLPSGFCLDRTSDDEYTFIEEMKRELAVVDELIGNINLGHDKPNPHTTFTYPFDQEGKAEKVSAQLEITMKLMPYVFAFNDKIQQCVIINELTGREVSFWRIGTETTGQPYDFSVKRVKHIIGRYAFPSPELRLEIQTLESNNGDDRIVIPPLPLGFDDVSSIPSQFLFFPLIGTENFGTNFIFHSKRLYPTERRNSFLLPKDNDGLIAKFRHNEKVLDEMIDVLFTYYDNNPFSQNLPIEFAEVSFRPEKQDDPVTRTYLQKLQDKFVNKFIHWKMIPTERGYLSMQDDCGFSVLHNDIYSTLSDDAIQQHMPALISYASKVRTLPSKDVVEWSRVVHGWKPDERNYYISLDEICGVIHGKGDDLKSFLSLLKELGTKGSDLLARYALIPNRDGVLCKSGDLRDAKDITPELYSIAKPLLGLKSQKLVDPGFAEVASLPKYDRTDLRDDIRSGIDELRRNTLKRVRWVYNGSVPDPVSLNDYDSQKLTALIRFCSAYPKDGVNTFRSRVMPTVCKIHGVDYVPSIIPQLVDDEADFYSNAFNYLLEDTLFVLSRKPSSWLEGENDGQTGLSLLKDFLAEYTATTDTDRLRRLDDYGVFPNRKHEMCLPKDLRKAEETPIPERILGLYQDLAAVVEASLKDYREVLVDEEFKSFYPFRTCKASEITDEMESMLREKDKDFSWDKTRTIVLGIIEGIDKGEWPDPNLFREIRQKQPTIFFKNAVSGEKGKHVYTLMRQNDSVIEDLAALAGNPDFAKIISKAKSLLLEEQQEEADFQFKKELGNHIEKLLRDKLSATLNSDGDDYRFQVADVQNGQDIVVSYKDDPIYYIEVKTKWNFTTSGPAYMSKNQVLKACQNADRYALCCVDLTDYDLPDRTYPESADGIHDRIRFLFDIGNTLEILMKPTLEADKTPDDLISIDGDYRARIPARVFRSGFSLEELVDRILRKTR